MTGGASDPPNSGPGAAADADPGAGSAARSVGILAAHLVVAVDSPMGSVTTGAASDEADPAPDGEASGIGAVSERRVSYTISRLAAARRTR